MAYHALAHTHSEVALAHEFMNHFPAKCAHTYGYNMYSYTVHAIFHDSVHSSLSLSQRTQLDIEWIFFKCIYNRVFETENNFIRC